MDERDVQSFRIPGKLKAVIALIVAVLIINTIVGLAYTLNEDEDAVITTLGVPTIVEDSGLHFKWPLIQRIEKVNMSTQELTIGYDRNTNASIENESLMITNDFNFVNVDFNIVWEVTDAVAYTYAAEDPELILKTLAMSYIRDTIGSHSIDEVLTTGKAQIQSEIKDKLIERLATENIGIAIRTVTIQDAEPPTQEVIQAFKNVEDSKQAAERIVNEAHKYRNQKLPEAEANANEAIKTAEAKKQARISEANGQIARFTAMYEEYVKFPEITKSRMYYEAMEEILPNLKVIIQDGNGTIVNILGQNDINTANLG